MLTHITPHLLHFRQPAGTSRGVYTTRRVWFVTLAFPGTDRIGIGECAPLPALSCDDVPDYADRLAEACAEAARNLQVPYDRFRDFPSILFGLEMAFARLFSDSWTLFPSPFTEGSKEIHINGLVWMGNFEEMKQRIDEKLNAGFGCIKLKIGAIDFEEELELLRLIRKRYAPRDLELRVDANGAFSPAEALARLEQLAPFALHSIEQPIQAGQWEQMRKLTLASPVPIALDEELIGINTPEKKSELMETIQPHYLVLKPSLHGGMKGTDEWLDLCRRHGKEAWFTSALESNIGLNAIAQWCATRAPFAHCDVQGLGTGHLYTNNIAFPYLHLEGDRLQFKRDVAEEIKLPD